MNKDRILKLADVVEKSSTFDQSMWWDQVRADQLMAPDHIRDRLLRGERCGTPCCLAGHALYQFPSSDPPRSWLEVLSKTLGMTDYQSELLSANEWDVEEIAIEFDLNLDDMWSLFKNHEIEPEWGERPIPYAHEVAATLRMIAEKL